MSLASVTTIAFALAGCQKEKSLNNGSGISNHAISALIDSNQYIALTDSQIDSVGIIHNNMLDQALSNLDLSQLANGNTFNLSKTAFIQTNYGGTSVDFRTATFDSVTTWENQGILSANVQQYMNLITSELVSDKQFSEISGYLSQLTSQVNNDPNLQDVEKQAVKIGISVALHSAQYWLPTEYGGNGKGFAYFVAISQAKGEGTPSAVAARPTLGHVVASDAIGGCVGGIGFCIGACFGGPIGVGAYVFACAFSAAAGSLLTCAGI